MLLIYRCCHCKNHCGNHDQERGEDGQGCCCCCFIVVVIVKIIVVIMIRKGVKMDKAAAAFRAIDTDHSGFLDREEFLKFTRWCCWSYLTFEISGLKVKCCDRRPLISRTTVQHPSEMALVDLHSTPISHSNLCSFEDCKLLKDSPTLVIKLAQF